MMLAEVRKTNPPKLKQPDNLSNSIIFHHHRSKEMMKMMMEKKIKMCQELTIQQTMPLFKYLRM